MSEQNHSKIAFIPNHLRSLVVWFVLISLLIITGSFLYFQIRAEETRALIALEEQHHVEIQSEVLKSDLTHISYILSYLRDQVRLHGHGESDWDRASFAQDIYSFMQSNELYDQIRFIDVNGMEVVRVDYNRGEPALVMQEELQFKGDRHYFRQSMTLGENEIYISPLDLNVELGKVELPYKPVIRFGMPVFSPQGEKLGVLMVNHLASTMLEAFKVFASPTLASSMLLNDQGYWLSHPDKSHSWGFMFEASEHQRMGRESPALWQKVLLSDQGQFDFNGDVVTVGTIYPYAGFSSIRKIKLSVLASQRFWKIVSIYPQSRLNEQLFSLKMRLSVSALLSMLITLLMLVLWRKSSLRKLQAQQEREQLLQELQQLSRRLIDLRDEEASRIGRALHDDVGQMLAAIQLQVGVTEQHCSDGDINRARVSNERIKEMSTTLYQVIHKQLLAIRADHLEELGLQVTLEELCLEWKSELDITLIIEKLPEDIDEKLQLCLFRVVQEALTNTIKYAQASQMEIRLSEQADKLHLLCRDNGCGFDQATIRRGLGLTGMQERISALAGEMAIHTVIGKGVALEVTLPIFRGEKD